MPLQMHGTRSLFAHAHIQSASEHMKILIYISAMLLLLLTILSLISGIAIIVNKFGGGTIHKDDVPFLYWGIIYIYMALMFMLNDALKKRLNKAKNTVKEKITGTSL